MNTRFILRALLLSLPIIVLITAVWVWLQTPWSRLPEPTPPPPTIHAPAGHVPDSPVAQRALARYGDGPFRPVGSGFFLQLESGRILAITAAHVVALGDSTRPLTAIAFDDPHSATRVGSFDTLLGKPGRRLTATDLSIDYLLLAVDGPVDLARVLTPDPRGAPQPGERVLLYSGVGDTAADPESASGSVRRLAGTVQSVSAHAVWVLMDDPFDPSQMSGSPLVSQHTGLAVAMAVAASPRRGALLIGAHPIASLVHHAESAGALYRLADWTDDLR